MIPLSDEQVREAPEYCPAHCVICVNLGVMNRPGRVKVGDYQACEEHAPLFEKAGSLRAVLKTVKRQTVRGAV